MNNLSKRDELMQGKFLYTIKKMSAEVSLAEYYQDCVDIPKFLAYCKACPNYGRLWSCPPFVFDPQSIWEKYKRIELFSWIFRPQERHREAEGALGEFFKEKDQLLNMLLERETCIPGSLALAAGSCALCHPCAREVGQPCRQQGRSRYSLEALGGDVGLTASSYFGYPLKWIKDDVLPEYLMLVGGLLLP